MEDDHATLLIDIMDQIGDKLSLYQDMVTQEAYLGTARRRISLRRHAQLLKHQLHEGLLAVNLLLAQIDSKKTIPSHRKMRRKSATSE